jgi:sarcosine oxidase
MTRLAVGEGSEYVPLVRRSHEVWREIEALTGTRMLTQPGGLIMSRAGSWFFEGTRELARRLEIEHEELSSAELRERFPMFAVDEETEGYYEPAAGFVRPEDAVRAQLELARRGGAELRPGERVLDWSASEHGVSVATDRARYPAEHVILCAGPWLPGLFPEGRDLFAVHRQVQYWFPIRQRYEQLRNMPVLVWDFGGERDGFVTSTASTAFPPWTARPAGSRLPRHTRREPSPTGASTPRHRRRPPPYTATASRPGSRGSAPIRCGPYRASTHDAREPFVIDRHPGHEAVLIVSPCSGHGFKHSPSIGEAVAQWVTQGRPELDLGPFRVPPAVR